MLCWRQLLRMSKGVSLFFLFVSTVIWTELGSTVPGMEAGRGDKWYSWRRGKISHLLITLFSFLNALPVPGSGLIALPAVFSETNNIRGQACLSAESVHDSVGLALQVLHYTSFVLCSLMEFKPGQQLHPELNATHFMSPWGILILYEIPLRPGPLWKWHWLSFLAIWPLLAADAE